MKINFDKVYCISYCRNIEKQNNIQKVMNYLGIDFEFIYGADYSNLEILKHKDLYFIPNEKICKYKNFQYYTHYIGASYDHYTAVIHAYESGANSVLIMEDDCTFINDISYIQWAFNNYPKDADLIKFGVFSTENIKNKKIYINNLEINENSKKFIKDNKYSISFVGSQLYGICNRKTMKQYIDYQFNNFCCVDRLPRMLALKYNINLYGLYQPLAIDPRENCNNIYFINKYTLLNNI